jgi:spermidine synthase
VKSTSLSQKKRSLLLVSVLLVSTSGLAYELVAGTMATYLIGQSVHQFSFAMGWFLAAMGLGSYLSRFAQKNLLSTILKIQILLSLTGGFSAAILFFAFAYTDTLYPFFFLLALLIGTGVGFEIPIILRLMGEENILSLAISDVFTFDYIGALFASMIFPLVLLPYFGLIRSSLFFGGMNVVSGFLLALNLSPHTVRREKILLGISGLILVMGFIFSERLTRFIEDKLYQDPIVFSKDTSYQRIVVTKWRNDTRLFLDGNLQFSTMDEFRYHESLVHVPIAYLKHVPQNVLVIGGGDGLAIRELLKYPEIQKITLIELDPVMVQLFSEHPHLKKINENSLQSPKLTIIQEDAFVYLKHNKVDFYYDLILTDLPDPNSYSLGKLYSVSFYLSLFQHLHKEGIFVTQSTSPLYSKDAYWCILETIRFAGKKIDTNFESIPYHAYIPSFGDWGFVMSGRGFNSKEIRSIEVPTQFLTTELIPSLLSFSKDMLPDSEPPINHLDSQVLISLYSKAFHRLYE